jgi:hypothetical protein
VSKGNSLVPTVKKTSYASNINTPTSKVTSSIPKPSLKLNNSIVSTNKPTFSLTISKYKQDSTVDSSFNNDGQKDKLNKSMNQQESISFCSAKKVSIKDEEASKKLSRNQAQTPISKSIIKSKIFKSYDISMTPNSKFSSSNMKKLTGGSIMTSSNKKK